MGARNEGRAKAAVERLHAEGALGKGVGTVEWLPLDLMDLVGVKAAAEQLMGLEERLDILGESTKARHLSLSTERSVASPASEISA